MKNSSIFSAIIGVAFFGITYLGLSFALVPSLLIGATAFGAGELVLRAREKKTLETENKSLYDTLIQAKNQNSQIKSMIGKIEDAEMNEDIKEINSSIGKIISTIEKNPKKYDNVKNFFNYYLPITMNILNKYDEIENQQLVSEESKKFMKQSKSMLSKINNAFKNQLSNLYQKEIVDTDAEMKVFDSMLKADGYYTSSDFNIKKSGMNGGSKN